MKDKYWFVMDAAGRLFVYCRDGRFNSVYPTNHTWTVDNAPYKFDGSECVTEDCLPAWTVDAYYAGPGDKNFPQNTVAAVDVQNVRE